MTSVTSHWPASTRGAPTSAVRSRHLSGEIFYITGSKKERKKFWHNRPLKIWLGVFSVFFLICLIFVQNVMSCTYFKKSQIYRYNYCNDCDSGIAWIFQWGGGAKRGSEATEWGEGVGGGVVSFLPW